MTTLQLNLPRSALHLTKVKPLSHYLFQRWRLGFHADLAKIHDRLTAAKFRLAPLLGAFCIQANSEKLVDLSIGFAIVFSACFFDWMNL